MTNTDAKALQVDFSDYWELRNSQLAIRPFIKTWRDSSIIQSMNLIRFKILLLLTVVSTRAATLSGTVRDSEGAVISNA